MKTWQILLFLIAGANFVMLESCGLDNKEYYAVLDSLQPGSILLAVDSADENGRTVQSSLHAIAIKARYHYEDEIGTKVPLDTIRGICPDCNISTDKYIISVKVLSDDLKKDFSDLFDFEARSYLEASSYYKTGSIDWTGKLKFRQPPCYCYIHPSILHLYRFDPLPWSPGYLKAEVRLSDGTQRIIPLNSTRCIGVTKPTNE